MHACACVRVYTYIHLYNAARINNSTNRVHNVRICIYMNSQPRRRLTKLINKRRRRRWWQTGTGTVTMLMTTRGTNHDGCSPLESWYARIFFAGHHMTWHRDSVRIRACPHLRSTAPRNTSSSPVVFWCFVVSAALVWGNQAAFSEEWSDEKWSDSYCCGHYECMMHEDVYECYIYT